MALLAGTRLGPHEILAPLGAGGMGEVYRARDTRLGRDVAIKVLLAHLSASPEVRARFEREARARTLRRTFSVADPAGVQIYKVVLAPDGHSYAYTYCCVLDDLYLVTGLK